MWGGDRKKNMPKYSFYTEKNQDTYILYFV